MAKKKIEPRVYLDGCIARDPLVYRESPESFQYARSHMYPVLRLKDLMDSTSSTRLRLRKPSFQRATTAWNIEQCVQLLDSFLRGLVVPSVIMWATPDHDYILDGGHRISVLIAWFDDNWGDKTQGDDELDDLQREQVKSTAKETRKVVKDTIGAFADYKTAVKERTKQPASIENSILQRANLYDQLDSAMHFPVVWAEGTIAQAQESYIRINRLGEAVSLWETSLIRHRDSPFIRILMSTVQPSRMKYYWPTVPSLHQQIEALQADILRINTTVFSPVPPSGTANDGIPLTYPLMHGTMDEKRDWFEEMFAIALGRDETIPESDPIFTQLPDHLVIPEGQKILKSVLASLDHLVGSSPKSLGIVPLLYTYNDQAVYVRGLLYGFWHWIQSGSADEILRRKRLFCVYRAQIETFFFEEKAKIIDKYSRQVGSGMEIMDNIATLYQGMLRILIECDGDTTQAKPHINQLLLVGKRKKTRDEDDIAVGVEFPKSTKKVTRVRTQLERSARCGICGGLLDIAGPSQDDHIVERANGGKGHPANQRLTHPFCNNNRKAIEDIQAKTVAIVLPEY